MPLRRSLRKRPKPPPPPWPALHGLLTPVAVQAFADLRVSISLWRGADFWFPLHWVENVTRFELEYGKGTPRWAYNERCYAEVLRTRKAVLGRHMGWCDLFVPVQDSDRMHGVLVAGPFSIAPATSASLQEQWYEITSSRGRLSDPSFSDYVSTSFSTLRFDPESYRAFERLMGCFSQLVGHAPSPERRATEIDALRNELLHVRLPERMWEAAREMADERLSVTWALQHEAVLHDLGLERMPQHAVVGLIESREKESNPVDGLVQRDAFQRACVDLSANFGEAVCARIGHHGVAFLVQRTGAKPRIQQTLNDLVGRADIVARRFGLKLFAGVSSQGNAGVTLPTRYRAALWAAEKALTEGVKVLHDEPRRRGSSELLRELRGELARSMRQPNQLAAHFDRYIEAVLAHSGYRVEFARGQLEAGLERLTDPLLASGFLDQKSYAEMFAILEHGSETAQTVAELVASYRQIVESIQVTLKDPVVARQDRGTLRALSFMREHLGEPLSIRQVAHIAGFAPDHFSKLFKRDVGTTPEDYLRRLRVDQAKETLISTPLNIEVVRRLCGFQSRIYFHRVFKQAVGVTPAVFRQREVRPTRRAALRARLRKTIRAL